MEPASTAIGAVSGAIALAEVAFKIAQTVSDVIKKYRTAPLILHSITSNCKAIEVAWTRIHHWASAEIANHDGSDPIFEDLIMFVNAGRVILDALRQDLDLEEFTFKSTQTWSRMKRYQLMSKEKALKERCDQLTAQVSSLNLLLSATRLSYSDSRETVIKLLKPVFRKDEDSAWTIVNSKAPSSKASSYWASLFNSADTKGPFLDHRFDFDYYLFTSPAYRRVFFPRSQSDNTDANSVVQIRHDGSNSYQLSESWPPLTAYNGSKPGGNKESHAANAIIGRTLKANKRAEQRTIKFLLLGVSESGKSTIIKQMRIIHADGFEVDERQVYKAVIYANMIRAIHILLEIMQSEEIECGEEKTKVHIQLLKETVADVDPGEAFSDDNVKEAMVGMWLDTGVQKAIVKGHEHALFDNLNFYYAHLDRMFIRDWIPDNQDILYSRVKSTGITETSFEMGHLNLRMMDVGGTRPERKKWIHCFDGAQCVLFVVALSGYDQCLVEDSHENQIHKAMTLFEILINREWFKNKPIILLLNKIDLFREKLLKSPISTYFPDYKGKDSDTETATAYFADRFRALNRTAGREVYTYYINATDTTLMRDTMQSIQDLVTASKKA